MPTRSQGMSKFLHQNLRNWPLTSFRTRLWLFSLVVTPFLCVFTPVKWSKHSQEYFIYTIFISLISTWSGRVAIAQSADGTLERQFTELWHPPFFMSYEASTLRSIYTIFISLISTWSGRVAIAQSTDGPTGVLELLNWAAKWLELTIELVRDLNGYCRDGHLGQVEHAHAILVRTWRPSLGFDLAW